MSDHLSRKEHASFAGACLYGKKPPCSCACPLNLDVSAMLTHVQEGSFTLAFKLYQSQAVFPGIVCAICDEPCRESCVRKDLDESISLRQLERACVDFSKTTEVARFNLPRKNARIAVIGAGLSGLACAQKLGAKNYQVTVYDQASRIGGRLWNLLAADELLPEIERQFANARCDFQLGKKIESLDVLKFDAAFIATGKGGNDFSLSEGLDGKSFGTRMPGVFLAGNLLNTTPVEDIAQGSTASHSIEKYLKTARMDGIPETFRCEQSLLAIDLSRVKRQEAVQPRHDGRYDQTEALQEAKRCLKCNCTACSDACELFSFFGKPPKTLVSDAVASLHTKASITGQTATRTLASCNLCGLCAEACPQAIDMGKFFHDFRHFKAEDKMFPPAFHDFFLRDMHFSNVEAYLVHAAPGYDRASYLFFPGCQLGASDPRYVEATYGFLLGKIQDMALCLGCCGAPADWAADKALNESIIQKLTADWEILGKPTFVFACPTCKHQFEKFVPAARSVSLYAILMENGLPEKLATMNSEACVFDPCASRYDPAMQQSVREIARRAKIELKEPFYSGKLAQCCGWGGHIGPANRTLADKISKNRVSADAHPYITYCTNCRDSFANEGKACLHILDVVFGLNSTNYVPPSLSQRRKNRLTAKKNLLEKLWKTSMDDLKDDTSSIKVEISNELLAKMNASLILEEDACKTIEYCESSGNKLLDSEKGCFIGHLRIGIITYWVEYLKKDDRYILCNIYSHRVEIVENE